jgi:outer membrane protein W
MNRLAFRVELVYSTATYNDAGVSTTSTANFLQYKVKQTNISPELSVLYYITGLEKWRWYAGLGIAYNISSYGVNSLHQSLPEMDIDNYLDLEKGWFSSSLKTGLRINTHWEVYLSGQILGDYSSANKFSLTPHTYLASVNYHFR